MTFNIKQFSILLMFVVKLVGILLVLLVVWLLLWSVCMCLCDKPTVQQAAERQDVQNEDPSVHPQ